MNIKDVKIIDNAHTKQLARATNYLSVGLEQADNTRYLSTIFLLVFHLQLQPDQPTQFLLHHNADSAHSTAEHENVHKQRSDRLFYVECFKKCIGSHNNSVPRCVVL